MMIRGMAIQWDQDIPEDFRLAHKSNCEVRVEGHVLCVENIIRNVWEPLCQELLERGLRVRDRSSFSFSQYDSRAEERIFDWRASDDWAGIVISLGGNSCEGTQNPMEDYIEFLGMPCKGFLKAGVNAIVTQRPKGGIYEVGRNQLFADRLLKLLGDPPHRRIGGCTLRGKAVYGWHRCEFSARCNVILPDSILATRDCYWCGTPYAHHSGVWISRPGTEATEFAVDEIGFDHGGGLHPIVLPVDAAQVLQSRLGTMRLCLEPIWRYEHRDAQRVLDCKRYLELVTGLDRGS